MNEIFVKSLGIDFGSSKTSVVAFVEINETPMEAPIIFAASSAETAFFPTAMTKIGQDSYAFFHQAIRRLTPKTKNDYYDELKEDLGDPNCGLEYDENSERVKKFFEALKTELTNSSCIPTNNENYFGKCLRTVSMLKYNFSRLENICFGYPAYYDPLWIKRYCDAMHDIVRKIFGEKTTIQYVPEPALAAYAYNYANNRSTSVNTSNPMVGESILVLDFGGHTLDIAIMKFAQVGDNIELQPVTEPKSEGLSVSMGKKITEDLCSHIYKGLYKFDAKVEDVKCRMFSQGMNESKPESLKYRNQAREFVLHYKPDARIPGSQDTVHVAFERTDYCESINIGKTYRNIVERIGNYLENANIPQRSIKYILFTGGMSSITQMRDYVMEQLSDWLVSPEENPARLIGRYSGDRTVLYRADTVADVELSSSNAVALGAALVASGKCKPLGTNQSIQSGSANGELQRELTEAKKRVEELEREKKMLENNLHKWRSQNQDLSNKVSDIEENICESCKQKIGKM